MLAKRFLLILSLLFIAAPAPLFAAGQGGLPLPRFVSLKSDEVNVRTGPGTRYPIQWVYRRSGMPVEIIEEYDLWRKIRDSEGNGGWVHKSMLEGKRNIMINSKEARVVRIDPEPQAKPILKAEPKVVARLMECQQDWCRIQISGRKGWIEKKYIWGVYASEKFD